MIKKGSNLDYGARPLRRAMEYCVEDPLSEELLRGEFQGKDEIVIDVVWDSNHEKILHLKFEGPMADDTQPQEVLAPRPRLRSRREAGR